VYIFIKVRGGDRGAGFSTHFFQGVINLLIYAEMHNLVPWGHFDFEYSKMIWDPNVTGNYTHEMPVASIVAIETEEGGQPGGPKHIPPYDPSATKTLPLQGNGMWNTYFEPLSDFSEDLARAGCHLPLVQLNELQLLPGMHYYSHWALRAWPLYLRRKERGEPNQTIHWPRDEAVYDPLWWLPKRQVEVVRAA